MWLAAESDDEYYVAEWRSVGKRNCEFYMLIYSRHFSRHNALHEKHAELLFEAIVIALLSSPVEKFTGCRCAILYDRCFISFVLYAITQANVMFRKHFLELFILDIFFKTFFI